MIYSTPPGEFAASHALITGNTVGWSIGLESAVRSDEIVQSDDAMRLGGRMIGDSAQKHEGIQIGKILTQTPSFANRLNNRCIQCRF